MKNAFSIDVEDWFCVYNFSKSIAYTAWDSCELRVERNTERLLSLLQRHRVKATFFILGWIAEKCPGLLRTIAEAGHEIATHGYAHIIVKNGTAEQFERDLTKSIEAIRACGVKEIIGFRAPSFSVTPEKKWIFDILARHGILYDSSVFPIAFHPDYASAGSPLSIHRITEKIVEFPMSCFRYMGMTLPCSGGGYLRLLPYAYTAFGIRRCNQDGRPAVIYVHPWEIDPDQPRVRNIPLSKKIRHYSNLDKTERRLDRLLTEFEFDTVRSVLGL